MFYRWESLFEEQTCDQLCSAYMLWLEALVCPKVWVCNFNGVLLRVSCNKLVTSSSDWYTHGQMELAPLLTNISREYYYQEVMYLTPNFF